MSDITAQIRSYTLPTVGNQFAELLASVRFEDVGKGRQGAVLTEIDRAGNIPLVRTTARFTAPAQCFGTIHDRLARQIQQLAALDLGFNNALIESYTNAYTTMGSHSDQALDLAADSSIAIFSCYKYPELATPPRMLLVAAKESSQAPIEIPLAHNSVIVFSVDTNRRLKHKIVLDKSARPPENQWLGITFRTSETFIRFRNESPYFLDDTPLTLADDAQRREFYQLRHRENHEPDFAYPQLTYTICESDLMPPA